MDVYTRPHFFRAVATAQLTGEQLRVLMCLLSREVDGHIHMWQREVAEMLGLAEPNVSRSIKALMRRGILSEKVATGHGKIPEFKIHPGFERAGREAPSN